MTFMTSFTREVVRFITRVLYFAVRNNRPTKATVGACSLMGLQVRPKLFYK